VSFWTDDLLSSILSNHFTNVVLHNAAAVPIVDVKVTLRR